MTKRTAKTSLQSFNTKIRDIRKNHEGTPGGFLTSVFFSLLEKRLAVNFSRLDQDSEVLIRWNKLLTSYLQDPRNAIEQDPFHIQAARGNLHKELFKGSMSWKVFIKACRVLQAIKIDFNIKLHLPSGKSIEHTAVMNLGDIYNEEEE